MNQTVQLTEKVINRINQIGNEVLGLINTGTMIEIWKGKRESINPSTGESTGNVMETANLNVSVPKALYTTINKAIESLKHSGKYIEIELNNQKLIAISTKADENRSLYFVQFTKPSQSRLVESTSEDFRNKFAEVFGSAPIPKTVPTTNANNDMDF